MLIVEFIELGVASIPFGNEPVVWLTNTGDVSSLRASIPTISSEGLKDPTEDGLVDVDTERYVGLDNWRLRILEFEVGETVKASTEAITIVAVDNTQWVFLCRFLRMDSTARIENIFWFMV